MSSPWDEAYEKLRAFADAGATAQEVNLYGVVLGRELPLPVTPEEHAQYAAVQARIIADELGGTLDE
jgi:hypothetical protein